MTDPPHEQSEPPEPAESRPWQLPRRPPHPLGMHALVDSCIAFLVIVIPLLFFQLDLGTIVIIGLLLGAAASPLTRRYETEALAKRPEPDAP